MHVFVRFKLKNVQILVEVTGLEPTTSWSRTKRATKLRYTSVFSPTRSRLIYYIILTPRCQENFC